jgi:hypothetical protein
MSMSWRVAGVLVGVALATAGCDKSSTTGTKPADETYAKKLIGVWEGSEDFGGKAETITVEFKADNGFRIAMGPFESTGTWKATKEEGKTVTVDTEGSDPLAEPGKGPNKTEKKTLSIVFEDANTVVMSQVGDKPNPLKLKRKT